MMKRLGVIVLLLGVLSWGMPASAASLGCLLPIGERYTQSCGISGPDGRALRIRVQQHLRRESGERPRNHHHNHHACTYSAGLYPSNPYATCCNTSDHSTCDAEATGSTAHRMHVLQPLYP